MSDTEAVLFANEAFYRAFAVGDPHAMERIWAAHDDVACLHPGWGPVFGRAEVLASWAAIFAAPRPPGIRCLDPRARLNGDVAFVICYEQLAGGRLVATNMFAREGAAWKMIMHQAGPVAAGSGPATDADSPTGSLH